MLRLCHQLQGTLYSTVIIQTRLAFAYSIQAVHCTAIASRHHVTPALKMVIIIASERRLSLLFGLDLLLIIEAQFLPLRRAQTALRLHELTVFLIRSIIIVLIDCIRHHLVQR